MYIMTYNYITCLGLKLMGGHFNVNFFFISREAPLIDNHQIAMTISAKCNKNAIQINHSLTGVVL